MQHDERDVLNEEIGEEEPVVTSGDEEVDDDEPEEESDTDTDTGGNEEESLRSPEREQW
jgi:hypothetical protein